MEPATHSVLGMKHCLFCALLLMPTGVLGFCSDYAETQCRIAIAVQMSLVKWTDQVITRISIADPELVHVDLITPTQILMVAGKRTGTTNLIIWYGDEQAEVYDVNVYIPGSLTERIKQQLSLLVPGARIRVLRGKDGVILDGEVNDQETLQRILSLVESYVPSYSNLIRVRGSQQVQLEVKIAEISRSGLKQMGLAYLRSGSTGTTGLFSGGQAFGQALTESGERQASDAVIAELRSQALINSPFGSAFQIFLHAIDDSSLAILSALNGQGLAKILASPTLVTMSGQEASFLVGGEFPIPVSNQLGQTTVQFKEFGVALRFTPTVIGNERITLQVAPEVSNPDFSLAVSSGGVAVPGITTRRGSTTLQLKDGQTFAMAGLLKEEISSVVNKLPFFGDVPILGTLFSSKEFQKDESELVIIVTPRLVRALNPSQIPALPGADIQNELTDVDFFLLNKGYPTGAFAGEMGFDR